MPTVDDVLRPAAARLRAAAHGDTPVEKGLRELMAQEADATSQPPHVVHRRKPTMWLVAAAASLAGGICVYAVVDGHDRPHTLAPAPSTPAPAPSTPAPAPSTPATPPTDAISPEGPVLSVDYRQPPPLYDPTTAWRLILTPTKTTDELSYAVGPSDRVAIVDSSSVQLIDHSIARGFDWIANVPLPVAPLNALALDHNDVLYGLWLDPSSATVEFEVVAIPLVGPMAGTVAATAPLPAAALGDLPACAFGLGPTGVVDRSGRIEGNLIDYVGGATLDVPAEQFDASTWRLDIRRAPDWGESAVDDFVVRTANTAVFATTVGPEHSQPVIAELHSDGTGQWWSLPEGWRLAASDLGGTVIVGPYRNSLGMDLIAISWFAVDAPPTDPGSTDSATLARIQLDPATFERIALPCSTPCSARHVTSDGAWWTFDGSTLTRYESNGTIATTVEVQGLPEAHLADISPAGDVGYFTVPADTEDPLAMLVAVALIGPRAGQPIGQSEWTFDATGDTILYPTASGLVPDGDFGPDLRPAPDHPALLPWLDIQARPVDGHGQWVSYSSATRQIRIDTPILGTLYLTLPEGLPDRGVPDVVLTRDGFLVFTYDWALDEAAIVFFGSSGPQLIEMPPGFEYVGLYDESLLVTDGTTLWRAPVSGSAKIGP